MISWSRYDRFLLYIYNDNLTVSIGNVPRDGLASIFGVHSTRRCRRPLLYCCALKGTICDSIHRPFVRTFPLDDTTILYCDGTTEIPYARSKPKALTKAGAVPAVLAVLFPMAAEPDGDDVAEDDETAVSPHKVCY